MFSIWAHLWAMLSSLGVVALDLLHNHWFHSTGQFEVELRVRFERNIPADRNGHVSNEVVRHQCLVQLIA